MEVGYASVRAREENEKNKRTREMKKMWSEGNDIVKPHDLKALL